ncbi:MAG: succinate dehydrogenase, cytochrome b556 subunit [Gammaproteobacteria bacterium]|nr:succinate dehydrogenase, cytochrome b556 subunit [Gammaproteobacteria bacterium]
MKDKRPVYLDVTKYKFPNTAIVSILHRISGVILFLYIPFLIWALDTSLSSGEHFQQLLYNFDWPVTKFFLWVLLASLIFHLVAGVRHLFMDMGIGETHRGGRLGANLVFIISLVLILVAGIWLW